MARRLIDPTQSVRPSSARELLSIEALAGDGTVSGQAPGQRGGNGTS